METITLTEQMRLAPTAQQVALSIMALAMESADVLNIHVSYSPHVAGISVAVYPTNTDYIAGEMNRLFNVYWHECSDTLDDLKAIEDKLIELVAEARDKAEVVA
ncbi:hypothetical protein NF212_16070 [Parasalinivibrio latis]|uniref:hypothetical protein n=1 Tax=Parasalinivibrio latis TaxID=2952610 RepID=UPI0030E157C1